MLEAESGFNDAPVVIIVVALSPQRRRAARTPGTCCSARSCSSWPSAPPIGLAVGWLGRPAAAPRGAARRPASTRSRCSASRSPPTRPARSLHGSRLPRRLPRRARPRQRAAAAPAGRPRLRRGRWAGSPRSACSSCSGCWPPRTSWPTRSCPRWSSAWCCCWSPGPLSVLVVASSPFRVPLARAGVPVLGRAARRRADRARDHPAGRGRAGRRRIFDLVFVLVVVFTLVQGPTLPWVARRLRLARGRRRRRPRRRVHAARASSTPTSSSCPVGPGAPGCTASRSSSCGCRTAPTSPWWSATARRFVPRQHRAPARRRADRRDGGGRPRGPSRKRRLRDGRQRAGGTGRLARLAAAGARPGWAPRVRRTCGPRGHTVGTRDSWSARERRRRAPASPTRRTTCRRTPTPAPRAATASRRAQSFTDDCADRVPRVRRPAPQGVQRRRRRLQGLGLLPHRQPGAPRVEPARARSASGSSGAEKAAASSKDAGRVGKRHLERVRGSSSKSVGRRLVVRPASSRRPGRLQRRPGPSVHRRGRRRPAVHRRRWHAAGGPALR